MAENIFTLANSGKWFDLSDLCRICGSISHQFFSIVNDNDLESNLIKLIAEYMPMLEVSENDTLSSYVCHQCASMLISWNEFYSAAINADKLMKSISCQNVESQPNSPPISDIDELCREEITENYGKIIKEELSENIEASDKINLKPENSVNGNKIHQEYKKNDDTNGESKQLLNIKKIPCPECEKTFYWEDGVKQHIKRVHRKTGLPREKKYFCDICKKSFMTKRNLVDHKRTHTGEKPFSCDLCGKSFTQQGSLWEHRKIESGLTNHICEICSRPFASNGRLKRHVNAIHLNIRNYQCKICGNDFKRPESLRNHLLVHTGERPFSCELCQKTFRYKRGLRAHLSKNNCGN